MSTSDKANDELALPQEGMDGVITSFVPMDGLGWIELEDGREVRFTARDLKGVESAPQEGARVHVDELEEWLGKPRATRVELLFDASDIVASVGGQSAPLAEPWPSCDRGHGPMTLVTSIQILLV